MSRPFPRFLAVLFVAGCTFNVDVASTSQSADTDGAFTEVRADLRGAGMRDGVVHVVGAARTGASATVTAGAVLAPGAALDDVVVRFTPAVAGVTALEIDRGASREVSWLETLEMVLPFAVDVDLDVEGAEVMVEGTGGAVRAHTRGGPLTVTGATEVDLETRGEPIQVQATSGTVTSSGGAIELMLAGALSVTTEAGDITGTLSEGGALRSASGRVEVALMGPLSQDLELTTQGGAIVLVVPLDSSLSLDLDSELGRIRVAAGGVTHDGVGPFTQALGSGGPRVVARSQSGTIDVVER